MIRLSAAALAVLVLSPSLARANEIVQSHDFSYEFTDFTNAASQSFTPIPANGFVATFNPFSTAQGTLISTVVSWSITSAFTGITGSTTSSYGANIGGEYFVGDVSYSGNGGGTGTGAGTSGTAVSASFTVPSIDTFVSADAGSAYDPAILAILTGDVPFTLQWDAGGSSGAFSARYIASGTLSVTGSASITYNYLPVPEPASALIVFPALALLAAMPRRRRG